MDGDDLDERDVVAADGPTRVLIVDDQAMIRMGLRMILDHEDDLVTVGEAGDGETAVALALEQRPDVVLMDIRMPVLDGVEATRRIRANPELDPVRVAVLTTFDDEEYVIGALGAGADAFLLKDCDPATLVACVRRVRDGGSMLDPGVTALVVQQWREGLRADAAADARWRTAVAGLTAREVDVLRAVARGASNTDIAHALDVTTATVKSHVHALLRKLGCTVRAQLVVAAYESGLVVPGCPDGPPPAPGSPVGAGAGEDGPGHTGPVSAGDEDARGTAARRVRRRLVVRGTVQGVGYRWSCAREAERLGLAGRVRNLDTGEVEIVAEGPADAVGRLEAWARRGPAYAMVTGVDVVVEEPAGLTWFHVDD